MSGENKRTSSFFILSVVIIYLFESEISFGTNFGLKKLLENDRMKTEQI
jgi:hypothetical protein